MKNNFLFQQALVTALLFACPSTYAAQNSKTQNTAQTLKKIGSIELPGTPGKRFDYLKIDYNNHRLFSAHLGANQLYVIDLKTHKLLNTISDTPGVEGIEYISEMNKVYTSNWGDKTIGVIDLAQMKVIRKIQARAKPDGLVYASDFQKLYVSDEQGKALIIIDVKKDTVIKTLEFKSETGMPQYDSISKKIYLNLQDQNLFAVIDPLTDTIEGTFPVGKCQGNHGMALDSENKLAFLGCEGNNLLSILSLTDYKPITELAIPEGVDVIAFDPGLRRIYAACYSGAISVIQEIDRSHFRQLEDFSVEPKVHSLAVDRETHRVYAPEQEENNKVVSKLIIFEPLTSPLEKKE